jgi:putative ABC transport system permease protein
MMKPAITPDWDDLDNRNSRWVNMVARLKPGVTMAQATAALQPIWHAERLIDFPFQKNQSAKNRAAYVDHARMTLVSGATGFSPLRDSINTPVKVLMGMAALVLLMACANVAGLLLVRAAGRTREMSVRYALGAKRQRIVQQLLAEGLMLGLAGGGLGLLLAQPVAALLIRRIQGLSEGDAPYSSAIDLRLLLITIGITLLTSIVFSLAPALQFWRPNLLPALKQQNTTVSGGALLLRRLSVGVQIALSVLLLAASGLFLRTVNNMRSEDLGFRPDHLVEFDVDPRLAGYETGQVDALDQRILTTLAALPGVKSVSATDDPELAGNNSETSLEVPGFKSSRSRDTTVEWTSVMPGYLGTIGAPLLAGRDLTDQDRAGATPVAVISKRAAELYYGSVQNALGRTFSFDSAQPDIHIVGIVGEVHHVDLRQTILPRVFHPYLQDKPHALTFVLRTVAAPGPLMETARQAMHQLDAKLALDSMRTMDLQLDRSMVEERTLALLATSFGLLAALMSAVGLYGVLAFDTVQRTREIGVRMALGASRSSVARLLMIETLRLAGVSILLSLPLAWAFARLAKSLLFGVETADPITYTTVALLVALVAVAASAIPTWRAASVEPMRALRYE